MRVGSQLARRSVFECPTLKARRRHEVESAGVQPHAVGSRLRLQPPGQPVGRLYEQELAVVVPHPAEGGR
jgi:hypothetical protein